MKPVYGLKMTVTRSDLPGVELTVDMEEVDRTKAAAENPALNALFEVFDSQTSGLAAA